MTTTTNPFRSDNTRGYDAAALRALNAEWERRGGPQIEDEDERRQLQEAILADPPAGVEVGA